MPSEKFGRKVLITGVAHDWLVTLTKASQQTNTPNTHTLSPLTGAWFMVGFFCRALIGSRIVLSTGFVAKPSRSNLREK